MHKVVVYHSPTITVWYYATHRLIHHKMHGPCAGEEFRKALLAGSGMLRKMGARGWLSDDRANSMVQYTDEQWARSTWFPSTKAAGWDCWAVVKPEKEVGSLSLARFVEACERMGMKTQCFAAVVPALNWLVDVTSKASSKYGHYAGSDYSPPPNEVPSLCQCSQQWNTRDLKPH